MAHDKYSTWNRQIWHPQKMLPWKISTRSKKMPKGYPICQGLNWVVFKRKLLSLLYDSDSWPCDFKAQFFPLQNYIPGTLLYLLVLGVGSISRVFVVLQKTNNIAVRYHLCWVPFWGGGIFDKKSALFVTLSMGAINVEWLKSFWPSASVRYFRLHYLAVLCLVIFRTPIFRTCLGRRLLKTYV